MLGFMYANQHNGYFEKIFKVLVWVKVASKSVLNSMLYGTAALKNPLIWLIKGF